MTDVRPFRGTRYNDEKISLDDVAAPPYDVISPAGQKSYYEKSPFNIVRLDFGRVLPTDTDDDNRYTRAASELAVWKDQGILLQDEKPALYACRQNFVRDGVATKITGVICLVKLTEFGEDVLPHEKTLSGPKRDRRSLLEACEANFSQIFALYSDQAGTVSDVLMRATASAADQKTTDEDGVVHEVWPITSADMISGIMDTLADQRLLIADGHHRYETSLNFAKDHRAAGTARASFDYVMMFLVDMIHEDLIILPTHRVIKVSDFSLDNLLLGLKSQFEVVETDWTARTPGQLEADGSSVRFGLYAQERFFEIRGDRNLLAEALVGDNSAACKRLDTTLLQETILGPLLNVASGDSSLSFTQDADIAIKRVESGEADAVFLLEPMLIEQVKLVAEAGDKMPQKSTYFYPKPRTGLILRELE